MISRFYFRDQSPFRIIITGFLAVILLGTFLLMLPVSSGSGQWTSFGASLFTATSAVCVTGLVIKDTATYWSVFGQVVILLLIQTGGLGIISVTAFIATASGRKISLLQRSLVQESISAHQVGGVVKMTAFIFRMTFITELIGALLMMPVFYREFGISGIWKSIFHSVSAFCNAGFDLMGEHSGKFSSLTFFSSSTSIVITISLLIIMGGIGFLTWDDFERHRLKFKEYRMQSKAILTTTAVLILLPALIFFFTDFADRGLKERLCLSLFQAITPRTAGFNTADLTALSSVGHAMIIILMLIGGSPGSTAGGMKTTTLAVLVANELAVIRKKKDVQLFGRRIEEQTIQSASTLLVIYLFLALTGAFIISISDSLPFTESLFEAASAIGTVGLSLGVTPSLGHLSRVVLIILMFWGRVGGLTLIYAAVNSKGIEVSHRPVEKINVG